MFTFRFQKNSLLFSSYRKSMFSMVIPWPSSMVALSWSNWLLCMQVNNRIHGLNCEGIIGLSLKETHTWYNQSFKILFVTKASFLRTRCPCFDHFRRRCKSDCNVFNDCNIKQTCKSLNFYFKQDSLFLQILPRDDGNKDEIYRIYAMINHSWSWLVRRFTRLSSRMPQTRKTTTHCFVSFLWRRLSVYRWCWWNWR